MFLNLETKKFYCLPDNYEVIDASLGDILYVLNPTFTPDLIERLANSAKEARAYDGTKYIPGVVGLNNIKVCMSIDVNKLKLYKLVQPSAQVE